MPGQTEITVVYNKFCPFAQRALLAALEKQLPARFHKASLKQKQPFLKQLYARAQGRDPTSDGKVPILVHGDQVLTESEVVCWYMAETFTSGSQLVPQNSFSRARMRLMIKQYADGVISLFNQAKSKQIKSVEGFQQKIKKFLQSFNKDIQGPFLLGNSISLADVLVYPWFERWIIMEHYFEVPIFGNLTKIKEWIQAMGKRESVRQTKMMTSDDYYISRSQKMIAKL